MIHKYYCKLEIKANFFGLIKGIHVKPTANDMLNKEAWLLSP